MAKIIEQTVLIPALPKQVYDALMNSKTHSEITGGTARISPKVGAKFTSFDGYAAGANLVLVPGKKIVQSWRAIDWPKGVESTLTISLAAVKGGTKLLFVQTGVPADQYESIRQGWIDYYWEPLRRYFKD